MDKNAKIDTVEISPIGVIHSCFTEKFGIPRQSGMIDAATAHLELYSPFDREEMVRGLDQFSHLWVNFLFHKTVAEGWKPTVRPPWLGGKKRVGVFASRSPHRPNHLGISAVRLLAVTSRQGRYGLDIGGVDLLDGTPVVDIKPYLPYSDAVIGATQGFGGVGQEQKEQRSVVFSETAEIFCDNYKALTGRDVRSLVKEMVGHDPRPASQKNNKTRFGMLLWDVNIRWRVEGRRFLVESCERLID